MIRENSIEEMAKIIGIPCYKRTDAYDDGSQECLLPRPCSECTAELLYNAGYRKIEAFSQPHENGGEWISVDDRLPENGVHCILCCDMKRIDGTHSQYVCDGYHAEKYKIPAGCVDDDCVTEYNEEDDEYYLKEGWYEVIENWDDYNSIVIDDTVTHWMLLPEIPKIKGE